MSQTPESDRPAGSSPFDVRISRRRATALTLGALGAPLVAPSVLRAAQPGAKSPLDDILFRERMERWTLRVNVHLRSYFEQAGATTVSAPFHVDQGTFVFPILRDSASHWVDTENVKGVLKWNDKPVVDKPSALIDHAGARFGLWKFSDKVGREADLDVELPMLCWETYFDEERAAEVEWPTEAWGPGAAATFTPQYAIDFTAKPVQDLLKQWTNNKDPKSIKPLTLAKFIAQQSVEYFQPSGDGTLNDRTGLLEGFDLKAASTTIADKRGSQHDIAVALVALYRAAGLPARPVIGWDLRESKGQDAALRGNKSGQLKSWVEFCLYDQKAKRELWLPVDVDRIRSKSSRAPKLDAKWKFFGTHDELDDALPFAFHYHPPMAGVVAHGAPCCWGWYTSPSTQIGDQWLKFSSITTPKRSNDPVDTGDYVLPPERPRRGH